MSAQIGSQKQFTVQINNHHACSLVSATSNETSRAQSSVFEMSSQSNSSVDYLHIREEKKGTL